jgi:O-Antigen ligase
VTRFAVQERAISGPPAAFIEKGLIVLAVATPLAFGSVQEGARALMEAGAFLIFGAWLIGMAVHGRIEARKAPHLWLIAAFFILVLIQLVPLPRGVLAAVSPGTDRLYDRAALAGGAHSAWRALSVFPRATRGALFEALACAAVFWVVVSHYRTKKQIEGLARAVLGTGIFLVVFAVVQKMTWNGKLYWVYPLDSSLASKTAYIWGPYVNRNHFAGYLEMVLPLGLGLMLHRSASLGHSPNATFIQKLSRAASSDRFTRLAGLGLAVLVMSAAVFMTLSRGGILGFAVSMLFFVGVVRTRRSFRKKAGILAALGLVVVLLIAAAGWDRVEGRFGELAEANRTKRIDVWADAARLSRDFPLVGTGLGTFPAVFPEYQTSYANVRFEHAENDYLELLTDTGLAGLCILAGLLAVHFYSVLKAWRLRHDPFVVSFAAGGLASCVALSVHSLFDFNLHVPANALLLTIIVALTYAAVYNVKSRAPRLVPGARETKE